MLEHELWNFLFEMLLQEKRPLGARELEGRSLQRVTALKASISMVTAQCFCNRVNNLVLFI